MSQIIKGFVAFFTEKAMNLAGVPQDPATKNAIEKRAAICEVCPFRKDMRCGVCGCVIAAKIRSASSCPKKFF